MTTASQLQGLAIDEANRIFERAEQLKPELHKLKKREAQIVETLHAADLARQRARDFVPALGPDFQCPRCWVEKEARSTLRPVRGTDDEEILRCPNCGRDWKVVI
jgi:DNA-directed RNA polymerase subunit M/transcription elongation factor TFIIS